MTTPTTVNVQFQLRADTAANWTAANPTLLANEFALETDTKKLKVGNGSTAWASLAYFPSIVSGGTVLGNLEIGSTGTLTFEGSTADGFETTLAVTDPTADRTITLPNQSGTVVVSGNASIVNADIAANAEIAVSKLANGTVNQVLVTDGTDVSWSDDLTIAGNLTVNGTTTTVNTQTLVVEDKNIELGVVGTPTDLTADGGGITLKGTTNKTINWVDATDSWTSSENIDLASGKSYRINGTEVLSGTALGSGVTSSSLTSVGTITAGTWQGTAIDATYLDSTVVTTGDTGTVTSTMIADGTIVNADVSGTAAIAGSKIDPDFGSQTVKTTGVFSAATGSNSAPSITFTGDLNTGIYSPGADQLAISTNGTQRINIEADGDINIDSGGVFYDATNNRLAVGTTSPGGPLEVQTGTGERIIFDSAGANQQPRIQLNRDSGVDYAIQNALGIFEILKGSDDVYRYASDAHQFYTAGVGERMRIDSSGRLLVGTSSALTAGNWSDSLIQVRGNSSGSTFEGKLALFTGRTIAAGIGAGQSLGRVAFGNGDGGEAAWITAQADAGWSSNDYPGRLVFSTTADGASSPTERMRITQDGNFYFNNTNTPSSAQYGTRIGGGSVQGFLSTARNVDGTNTVFDVYGNAGRFRVLGDGNAENTNNSYTGISDLKLKENIVVASPQWDDIKALQVRNYNFKPETGYNTHTQLGLIAQEVELVSPGLVSESPDRDEEGNDLGTVTKSVNYSVLYMKAVKALQEAMERIEQLEAEMAEVKAQLS